MTILSSLLLLVLHSVSFVAADESRPNFIFLFTDDLGFGDLKSYGHPYAITDNLDRLAEEGTAFRKFHNTGNICPNSRTGFMTSRNPSWFANYTPDYGFRGAITVTKLLQQGGYTTGHIGKWNIGEPKPDSSDRMHEEYGISHLRITGDGRNDPRGKEGERIDLAIDFVERYQDQPFYLNVWMYAPHSPIIPPAHLTAPFDGLEVDRSLFAFHMQERFDQMINVGADITVAMQKFHGEIHGLDLQIGRLLVRLDELGLSENTVVVFSSDNGPSWPDGREDEHSAGYGGGLRGGKHEWYEGGPRVPFLVRWPGHVPAGKVNTESFFSALDWLPTVCTLAGVDVPWELVEGEDVSDIWKGSDRSRNNPTFYQDPGSPRIAVRYGGWKLLRWKRELYNLDADFEERNNVYDDNPDIVAAMRNLIDQYRATIPNDHAFDNDSPVPFDPTAPVQTIVIPELLLLEAGASPQPTVPPSDPPTLSPMASPEPTPEPTVATTNPGDPSAPPTTTMPASPIPTTNPGGSTDLPATTPLPTTSSGSCLGCLLVPGLLFLVSFFVLQR